MPQPTLCNHRGCPLYAQTNERYCSTHIGQHSRATYLRKSANPHEQARQRIYQSARWRNQTRPTVLKRDGYLCVNCGAADDLVVDHIVSILECDDPYDIDNLQTLCRSCSGTKDAPRASRQGESATHHRHNTTRQ